ncbi:MAG TPA: 3-oxoadipate enol-lactonase [Vicinamibacterales bacterium]|nr:3-oxoadipate enol-lactonase [Vicinamibacterales bacterium]
MPLLSLPTARCFYRLEGRDDAPALVLSHSLGLDHGMWDRQAADLARHFRVLRYDTRGHGASDATPGDYTIAQLAGDVLALADALGLERFAFCGLSLGGAIGQWLGAYAAERVSHLVLANTSARLGDPSLMESRRQAVLAGGLAAIEEVAMARYFTRRKLAAADTDVAYARRTLLATDPAGYAGCCAALRDLDQVALLPRIRVPTLVIGGDADVPMPWPEHSAVLASRIPGARAVQLPAGHLSNLERPRGFSAALFEFLRPEGPGDPEAGMIVRRRVLGDEHVDRAVASTTAFTRAFQALITQYAWGTIWTRPGLDPRTRRLLVLATTAALGRLDEFRLHVRTGLDHELEPSDLEEVLLQTAVYAGVPAANAAFHAAAAILAERESPGPA